MKCLGLLFCILFSTFSYALTLNIGSSNFNPPFESWIVKNNVHYNFGYDVDLMNEICKRLDATCIFHPFDVTNLFGQLAAHNLDLAIASIIVTDERRKLYLFTLPYLESKSQFITNLNSPLNKLSDLYGKTIGVKKGTVYGDYVKSSNLNNTIVSYATAEDMFVGLQQHEIDACLMDYFSAEYWMATAPGVYKLVGGKLPIGHGYAIMVNSQEPELVQSINRILIQMENDGTYLKLYSQYFN